MCTLLWRQEGVSLDLRFNRDEKNERARETEPVVREAEDVRWLAPVDPEGRGTWLAVNDRGLVAALLNDYLTAWRPESPSVSRGRLVTAAVGCRSIEAAVAAVRAWPRARTGPFHLALFGPGVPARLLHWEGRRLGLAVLPEAGCLTSSSFRPAEVAARRLEHWAELTGGRLSGVTARRMAAFQKWHDPAQPAFSVQMKREDAATRSLSRVEVRPGRARFRWEPIHPQPGPAVERSLAWR